MIATHEPVIHEHAAQRGEIGVRVLQDGVDLAFGILAFFIKALNEPTQENELLLDCNRNTHDPILAHERRKNLRFCGFRLAAAVGAGCPREDLRQIVAGPQPCSLKSKLRRCSRHIFNDQTGDAEHSDVSRGLLKTQTESCGEFRPRERAEGQTTNDPQASLVRKRLEEVRGALAVRRINHVTQSPSRAR